MCCYECEWPKVFNEKMVTARKTHTCCECGSDIDPGEKYQLISGLWDEEWAHYKTCQICIKIRSAAQSGLNCCIPYGELYYTIGSEFEEEGI